MTYTPPTRNQIFQALFDRTSGLDLVSAGAFVNRSRKFKHFSKVDKATMPVLFQVEFVDLTTAKTGMPAKRNFKAAWWIYFGSDPGDDSDIPTIRLNDIVDALENCLADPFNQQTLGGLVAHTFIDGEIIKVSGDDDGIGIIIVPITILGP